MTGMCPTTNRSLPSPPSSSIPGCTRRTAELGTAAVLGSHEPFLPSLGLTLCLAPYQLLSEEAAPPAPLSRMTEEQLWLFAREAEVNKDYDLASLYHQQVKEPLFFPARLLCVWAGSQHAITAAWGPRC